MMAKKTLEEEINDSSRASEVIKKWLKKEEEVVNKKYKHKGLEGSIAFSNIMDDIICSLYVTSPNALPKKEVALIALGGYGRQELNIHSDVDLMLLYEGNITDEIKELTDRIIYTLWDAGVDLAFSIRSIKDCVLLSKTDLKTLTSFLDTRHLYGNKELSGKLIKDIEKNYFTSKKALKFATEKIEENDQRRLKFGGSVYILEPNIKEGEGGLRDYHTARWVASSINGLAYNPLKAGLLKKDEKESLAKSFDYLLKIRNSLHLYRNKKQDQLTFDAQSHLAKEYNYKTTDSSLAVEKFMQEYFKHATAVKILSTRMISRLLDKEEKANEKSKIWPFKSKRTDIKLDENFVLSGGKIIATNKNVFEDNPVNMMLIFKHFQKNNATLERNTKDLLLSNLKKVNASFRKDKDCAKIFLDILREKNLFWTLTEMHRTTFLDKYIPEFENIRCKMQHDMYHVFTVDAHTLFAVRELERLKSSKDYKERYPLQAQIIKEIDDMAPLVLGVMFHDIGKALGKGHAEKGANLVPLICRRLNMNDKQISLVKFLVLKHLILANTAQYRDIYDDKLVIDFSKNVGTEERLNNLYLLTFADVRAVGPEVWTEWKGSLFKDLYLKAQTMLKRGTFEVEDSGELINEKRNAVRLLLPEKTDIVNNHFKMLPIRYFLSNTAEVVARHITILERAGSEAVVIDIVHNKRNKYTELTVATEDMFSLFYNITGVMAANNINILDAKVNTLKNGIALDVLQLNNLKGSYISDERKLEKIKKDLINTITGQVQVSTLVKANKPSILDDRVTPNIKQSVIIDNESSDDYTVIDMRTYDRVGLLYSIAQKIVDLGLTIHIAKISTKGLEAADIFYVTDIFGQKVYFEEKLKNIIESLYDTINSLESQKSA